MNYLDGKNNLRKTMLRKLMQTKSDEIMLTYTNVNNEEIVETYSKDELFKNLFCKKVYDNITDETVVTIATDDLVIETLKIDIGWWMKPIHFAKLEELVTSKKPAEKTKQQTDLLALEKRITKRLQATSFGIVQKPEIIEKKIAVGTYDEQTGKIYDVHAITVSTDKPNLSKSQVGEVLNWLNEKIEQYKLHRKYEKLRVCLNYATHSSSSVEGWFTIEELIEKGIAKV